MGSNMRPRLQEVLEVCEQRVVLYIMSFLTLEDLLRLQGVSKGIRSVVNLELQKYDAGDWARAITSNALEKYDPGDWTRAITSNALVTDEPMYMRMQQFVSYFIAEKRLDMNQKRLLCIYMKEAFTYYDPYYRWFDTYYFWYGQMIKKPLILTNSPFKSHRTHFKNALVCLSDTLNLNKKPFLKPLSVYVPQMREFARKTDRLLMEQEDVLDTFKEELVRAFELNPMDRRIEKNMHAICHLPHLLLKLFRFFLRY